MSGTGTLSSSLVQGEWMFHTADVLYGIRGKETIIYRESAECLALETQTRLPCPYGAYSPLQETDVKQVRLQ